jgi:hypothetical protein
MIWPAIRIGMVIYGLQILLKRIPTTLYWLGNKLETLKEKYESNCLYSPGRVECYCNIAFCYDLPSQRAV